MDSIYHGTAELLLKGDWSADCILMDPPDNLGLDYDGMVDSRINYIGWLNQIIAQAMRKTKVLWVSYYWHHDIDIKRSLMLNGKDARTFVWTYTFGQDRVGDCGSGYRPILRIADHGYPWSAEDIKVPSWRQEHGDKRARPGGKVPLDVWDFPRVVGNSAERRSWHPTQHPEALYIRMLRLSGAAMPKAFHAVDLFGGTGTMLRAARQLRTKNPEFRASVVEQSLTYCQRMAEENPDSRIIESGWR